MLRDPIFGVLLHLRFRAGLRAALFGLLFLGPLARARAPPCQPSGLRPCCEPRQGRRVNNSPAAGKLQGGEVHENCVEGALERGLAGGERGVRGVRGQQRRVGLGACWRPG